jgi:hypothetical protein
MNAKNYSLLFLFALITVTACKKPDYPNEPELEYKSISKTYMKQNGQDSLVLTFAYTDGDGDIGSDVNDNIFVRDSRTGGLIASYRFPNDTDQEVGAYRKGELQLIIYSACCIYNDTSYADCGPNPNQLEDTLRYTIEVVDQSGNESNIIESDEVYLECN